MSDRERLIVRWRKLVADHFRGREDVLDELEEHLRDEVDRLIRAGLFPNQAIVAAAARLGDPAGIASEFAKIPPRDAPWLPVRVAWVGGVVLAASIVGPLAPRLGVGGLPALLAAHMAAVTIGYVATLAIGFLAACFLLARLFRAPDPGTQRALRQATLSFSLLAAVMTGGGIIAGAFCPFEKRGWCYGLDTREVGGLAILAWDLMVFVCCFLCHRASAVLDLVLVGIAGNILVILGWLGAAAVESPGAGLLRNWPAISGLVLIQVVIGCSVFAPPGWLRGRES
jgi:hypothetical protein